MVIQELQKLCGKELYTDPTRNFWGVHKFQNGDHLDIHVDAGSHPLTGKKKVLTLGIYLSKNWEDNQTGALELWNGDNASLDTAKIYDCKISLKPLFNRMILFNNDDYSWHGMPKPVIATGEEEIICLTISYFSNHHLYRNRNIKRIFCAHLE
jgi:Rps23 Pro-64 3,4-dihydroxylase Tpa1-like proline 4-hydroxylase